MPGHLSVAEAAEALGASPQTVRTLLRTGELTGEKRPWGSRFVWAVTSESVDDFLSQHGRLDGRRRSSSRAAPAPAAPADVVDPAQPAPPVAPVPDSEPEEGDHRRWFLRPRGRATVIVLVVGLPLLLAYLWARIAPTAWWFDELGRRDLLEGYLGAQLRVYLLAGTVAGTAVALNLATATATARGSTARAWPRRLALVGAALLTGTLFGSAAREHWEVYVLWRHRQPFGTTDPVFGKDLGFFVFTLPLELEAWRWLSTLLLTLVGMVVVVHLVRGTLRLRPWHAEPGVQVHLAVLAAGVLLAGAWRLHLQRYLLSLGQPTPDQGHSFAGVGYVDDNIRIPGLTALAALLVVLAGLCVVAPFAARATSARLVRRTAVALAVGTAVVVPVVALVTPALVQRYVVDPNPQLSEQPYLAGSIDATRAGLGIEDAATEQYAPTGRITAADFAAARDRLARVPAWDNYVLGARMRELASEPAYFRPAEPVLDVVRVDGRPQATAVSAREVDLGEVPDDAGGSWATTHLVYTHGVGLIRFSSTDVTRDRGPRLLDGGDGLPEPRLYFGNLTRAEEEQPGEETGLGLLDPVLDPDMGSAPWALVDTRRPEVDLPVPDGAPRVPYHYDGSGGVPVSGWTRRIVYALALDRTELLLSDDITEDSRLLLHQDVHDRLDTLAPFLQWDSDAVPLTARGRVYFVVDGYTTSTSFPQAEQVPLGGTQVSYARPSVTATVDAFSGEVRVYATDDDDPLLTAWRQAFPSLFLPASRIPGELAPRLRYPQDLFAAQAQAYEEYHVTDPDVFASRSDVWTRPAALSGPIEVAGGVDFDESDEDELRTTLEPRYIYAPPPGSSDDDPSLVATTEFVPSSGENLVATLSGWIDSDGNARLAARSLPRSPLTLGPAQVSRLVFATPRVRNLLGLRNLEIGDLQKSSLDSVLLGQPRLVFLEGGLVQVQNLYEGARGPGAARLLGVTAFVNGRAGLGPDVLSAVRQALNEPPEVQARLPVADVHVGDRVAVGFRVTDAARETVTIRSPAGVQRWTRRVQQGEGSVSWRPRESGPAHVRISVAGLDGTVVSDSAVVRVLDPPPRLRLLDRPTSARAGRPVRVRFEVQDATGESVTVSTRQGVVFERRFTVRDGAGEVLWVPDRAGTAVLTLRVHGRQGQTVTRRLRLEVSARAAAAPPSATFTRLPRSPDAGSPATIVFRADGCDDAVARVEGPDRRTWSWSYTCPVQPGRLTWTPPEPGAYVVTVTARGGQTSSRATARVVVEDGRP